MPTLDELHKIVNGQLFETVPVRNTGWLLVCDEEALLKDEPVLNELASKLAGHMICGDVGVLSVEGEDLIGFDFSTALHILTTIKIDLID